MNNIDFKVFGNAENFKDHFDLSKASVIECLTAYANSKKDSCSTIIRQYRNTINHLKSIETESNIVLDPPVIGLLFFQSFATYLSNKGLAESTITGHIDKMRCALKWAAFYGATLPKDFTSYKTHNCNKKQQIALTEYEVLQIAYFDINSLSVRPQKKKSLEKVRDQFVLSCYLGQRYSDIMRVDKTNFDNGGMNVFKITQQKTGNIAQLYWQKIYNEGCPEIVLDILKKYDYKAPYPHCIINYNKHLHDLLMYIPAFNKDVTTEVRERGKIVEKQVKKYKLIASHTARRTFITNAVKRDVNTQYIKQASGHVSDSSFGKYVIFGR